MQDQDSRAMQVDSRTEEFLRELGGEAHHVSMSRGVIRNGVTIVTVGPSEGKEAKIQKIRLDISGLPKIGGDPKSLSARKGDSGQALKSLPKVKGCERMENWYAMKTLPEKEEEAAELIRPTIPPSLWESVQSFGRKSCSGRREIDSEYGEDVSRLHLFINRPDRGSVRNVKTIERISLIFLGKAGDSSPDGRERSGISETGLRGAAGSADGTFPGRQTKKGI